MNVIAALFFIQKSNNYFREYKNMEILDMTNKLKTEVRYEQKKLDEASSFFRANFDKIILFLDKNKDKKLVSKIKSYTEISLFFYIFDIILNERFGYLHKENQMKFSKKKSIITKYLKGHKFLVDILQGNYIFNKYQELSLTLDDKAVAVITFLKGVIENRLIYFEVDISMGTCIDDDQRNYKMIPSDNPLKIFVSSDLKLVELNKNRTRNIILLDNYSHQVSYDLYDEKVFLVPKIPFSDFEHDTNRLFTEDVIKDFFV